MIVEVETCLRSHRAIGASGAILPYIRTNLPSSSRCLDAQRPEKLYRIGMLERPSTAINAANLDGFRRGLRELGYVDTNGGMIRTPNRIRDDEVRRRAA